MRSPAAEILDTALALQRAPGERFRLRDRPLPSGLVHVLEVASGSPQALSAAAAELGESEDTLLEAARFYLEQVLFAAPDADAYRILGVAPDAPVDEIRTHHRWLQRWLHPDRAKAGDATVFATRVNQAWASLRTPESRHQYDVRRAEARLAGASAPLHAATVRHWEGEDLTPRPGSRSRWLVAAALTACAVLAVLIVRHEQGPQPWSPSESRVAAESPAPADTPTIEDRDLGILTEALTVASPPTVGAAQAATPVQSEPTPDRHLERAPEAPEPTPIANYTHPAPPIAAPAPPPRTPDGTPIKSTVQIATTKAVEPAPVRLSKATPSPNPLPVGAAQAATPLAAIPPPNIPAPPPTFPAPVPPDATTQLLDRMHQAQRRYAELTAYLAAQPGSAPAWSDSESQAAADKVRQRMAVHGTVEFAPPNWRVQLENASLNVDYRCSKCGVSKGRLDVQLVWREGLWRVRGIDLAPAA